MAILSTGPSENNVVNSTGTRPTQSVTVKNRRPKYNRGIRCSYLGLQPYWSTVPVCVRKIKCRTVLSPVMASRV